MIMNSGGSTTAYATTITSSQQIYNPGGGMTATAATTGTSSNLEEDDYVSSSLLYNLSILQEKIRQIESFVSDHLFIISQNHNHHSSSTSLIMANIGTLVQEIISAATSMLFTCQHLHIKSYNNRNNSRHGNGDDGNIEATMMEFSRQETDPDHNGFMRDSDDFMQARGQISFSDNHITQDFECTKVVKNTLSSSSSDKINTRSETMILNTKNYDIVELDASDLLAKYTHYCQICGKGFRRDANLRMHMRAHGDEYKTPEALVNPKNRRGDNSSTAAMIGQDKKKEKHYYSCPHEGCRWNQRHEKFQPLKSIICVKNHYKRSHCPKLYVCRRCNVKQFSVLSDLRTHEKHCGDVKWVCSCGTRFSRKDKLMSHVALFVGHAPADAAAKYGQVRPGKLTYN